jgi:tRNASer (uridine44-2'-O)-methyltransferase
MVPHVDRAEDVPYYHPVLRKLAFKYSSEIPSGSASNAKNADEVTAELADSGAEAKGTISISILPFPTEPSSALQQGNQSPITSTSASSTDEPAQITSLSSVLPNRTYRTCLHLLETLHKHGWGRITGYQKRVVHDVRLKFHIIRSYIIFVTLLARYLPRCPFSIAAFPPHPVADFSLSSCR